MIELRGHHVSELARYFFSATKSLDDFNPVVKSLFDKLLSDSSNLVRIVSGLDSICAKCDHASNSCSFIEEGDEDSFILREYKLSVGDTKSITDLFSIFDSYKNNSKYQTPRALFNEVYEIDKMFPNLKKIYF